MVLCLQKPIGLMGTKELYFKLHLTQLTLIYLNFNQEEIDKQVAVFNKNVNLKALKIHLYG